jgi:alkylated DNA repair dioxygenase AlkB
LAQSTIASKPYCATIQKVIFSFSSNTAALNFYYNKIEHKMKRGRGPQKLEGFRRDRASTCAFFSPKQNKRKQSGDVSDLNSRFQSCPLCDKSLPLHLIESHASACLGKNSDNNGKSDDNSTLALPSQEVHVVERKASTDKCAVSIVSPEEAKRQWSSIIKDKREESSTHEILDSYSCSRPLPGLVILEDFISLQEEGELIEMLDGTSTTDKFLPWTQSRFNGKHFGKRWGVHCSLKDRKVYPEENSLPQTIANIIDRISALKMMKGCNPNEANAIDYRRFKGDYLKSHVDDRQLSKEPIANLSLAGDCYMTFRLQKQKSSDLPQEHKVFLKRRTVQLLTGSARYDYSHGIQNEDLLSDRRVSITMRESPLTK